MATRKCGNIYFQKYFMAVRKFTNISIMQGRVFITPQEAM